jgi:hypothetical protein
MPVNILSLPPPDKSESQIAPLLDNPSQTAERRYAVRYA